MRKWKGKKRLAKKAGLRNEEGRKPLPGKKKNKKKHDLYYLFHRLFYKDLIAHDKAFKHLP